MSLQVQLAVLVLLITSSASAQQTIYWKKDHVYVNGKEVAIMTPNPTDPTAPTAPSGLTQSNLTATSVQLNWTGSTDSGGSGLAGYKLYRQRGTGASLPVGTTAPGVLSFLDQPLQPSSQYSYRIVAFDVAQNHSANSNTVTLTTPSSTGDVTAPAAPLNLRGRGLTRAPSYKVRLDWNASTDAGGSGIFGYKVYRNDVLVSGGTPITTLYYEDTTSTANTSFTYKIKSVDGANNHSAYSSALAVTTLRELAYSDDFNRADEAGSGNYYVRSNTLQLVPTISPLYWYDRIPTASQTNFKAAAVLLNVPANFYAGLFFWGDTGTSRYRALRFGSSVYLYFYTSTNTETLITSASGIPSGPGTLTVEATSSTRNIKVYWNGTLKINFTETDTSRPNSGKVGLTSFLYSSTVGDLLFDDFLVEK